MNYKLINEHDDHVSLLNGTWKSDEQPDDVCRCASARILIRGHDVCSRRQIQ